MTQGSLGTKTDTGRVYAMKTLQKAEMLKRDQVCLTFPFTSPQRLSPAARTRPRRARRSCRVNIALGRAIVLLLSRSSLSVPDHGVPTGWGPNDDADEI